MDVDFLPLCINCAKAAFFSFQTVLENTNMVVIKCNSVAHDVSLYGTETEF